MSNIVTIINNKRQVIIDAHNNNTIVVSDTKRNIFAVKSQQTLSQSFDAKSPSDVDFYSVDFGDWLSVDTITSATVTTNPSGLTVGTPVVANNCVTVLLSGGSSTVEYIVTYTVVTASEQNVVQTVILPVG